MSDTTPLTAIERLQAAEQSDKSLFTDFSRIVGLKSDDWKSEAWKRKLRAELVREHIAAEKKKNTPIKASLRKLFKLN